jgi:hypothetical protein
MLYANVIYPNARETTTMPLVQPPRLQELEAEILGLPRCQILRLKEVFGTVVTSLNRAGVNLPF